jgi:hypothetical protein
MKKLFYFLLLALVTVGISSCSDDDDIKVFDVTVQLTNSGSTSIDLSGITVKMTNNSGSAYEAETDANGAALFTLPAGLYEASASGTKSVDGYTYAFNGLVSNVAVAETTTSPITVALTESKSSQIVIKELYAGGCQKDDGSGVYQTDKYVILYNNSAFDASISNLCFGMCTPLNAHGTNSDYVDGKLGYEGEGWIPAGYAIWYAQGTVEIPAYSQIVVAINGAIDHTGTYSNSVDLSNADYCMYDLDVYTLATYYPAPSSTISSSNYLKAVNFGQGTAWPMSAISPAFFVFQTKGTDPVAFANDPDKTNYYDGKTTAPNTRKMVPTDWVLDAVEVYTTTSTANQKRLTSAVDAGYVYFTNKYGYTVYRNVDKEATEAIEGNSSKLVYSYSLGVDTSTDPSGIDAEASIKNGAKIVYKDTNNSTNDFHQRSKSSLRN